MTDRVVLNNIDHHDLKFAPRHGAAYGDAVNQVPVFATEFEEVQREFPILFRRGAEAPFEAVALLGLDRDENLFLDGEHWTTRYVPALFQRGPFSIGVPPQAQDPLEPAEPMVHVDLDDPRISREQGVPLFLPQGGNAPVLDQVAHVLRTIYAGFDFNRAMFAAFEEFDLLEPVALEISLSDVERYNVTDHYTIAQDRLAALEGAALERLNRAGFLRAAYLAAASLGNIGQLIARKNARRAVP